MGQLPRSVFLYGLLCFYFGLNELEVFRGERCGANIQHEVKEVDGYSCCKYQRSKVIVIWQS